MFHCPITKPHLPSHQFLPSPGLRSPITVYASPGHPPLQTALPHHRASSLSPGPPPTLQTSLPHHRAPSPCLTSPLTSSPSPGPRSPITAYLSPGPSPLQAPLTHHCASPPLSPASLHQVSDHPSQLTHHQALLLPRLYCPITVPPLPSHQFPP